MAKIRKTKARGRIRRTRVPRGLSIQRLNPRMAVVTGDINWLVKATWFYKKAEEAFNKVK